MNREILPAMISIPLSNGGHTLVDDDDGPYLSQFTWSQTPLGYIQAWVHGRRVSMHRFVMKAAKGQEIDHRNRLKYDNRKENLRFCTRSENMFNLDDNGDAHRIYDLPKGVTYKKRDGKYYAQTVGKFLGSFDTADEAHAAWSAYYNRTAIE
jgi:hypothetical protein